MIIVITGIGIVSPVGIGKDSYWDALISGKTGFKEITLFDVSSLNVRVAGEITEFDPLKFLGKKGLRDLDRSTKLICSAARLAIEDAGLVITENNTDDIGVSIGTTFGSLHSISQFDKVGLIEGPRFVNPSHFPNTVINSPASQVSIRFGIKGFNTTISTGFCSGLDSISYASDFIKLMRAKVVLAGAVEELCEETFYGFYKLGFLSGSNGQETLCCPFDLRRNGIILSEGAAALVLEDLDHARERGANILAVVYGYANAFDPSSDISFRHKGQGLKDAIKIALDEASLNLEDIDYISSSANSSPGLDRMETGVIKELFGEHAYRIPVSSIKSMIGETFSASGAMAVASAVGVIRRGIIPPTFNLLKRDPACDLDYVPNEAREKKVEKALIISADPYGNNAAVIIGRYTGE